MAKRTAIIDIGSNSARMVVFEKSSPYAFHLIKEIKSRIRIGEGAYENGSLLQEEPMQRAYNALEDFTHIIKNLKCQKTFCVATSALRDAPNAKEFVKKIKKNLNLNIKIIDGKKEAYYGALSSINLLKPIEDATTIDIGGGSTELAKIKDGKIVDTISIDIGTVRLKELFFDKKNESKEAQEYIIEKIQDLPEHFKSGTIIGIGGTIRAFSNMVMDKMDYPLKTLHGFEYNIEEYHYLLKQITQCDVLELKDLNVKKDRYDTMREGCSIFNSLIHLLDAKHIITNGAGVREGVYLQDLLRSSNEKFPANFKVSVKSLSDRFISDTKESQYVSKTAIELFDALEYIHQIDPIYKKELRVAAKLYNIGRYLSFYQEHLHSFYFIINNLNYNFSHEERVLIAILVKYHTKKLPSFEDIKAYEILLPKIEIVNWLSFIISLAKSLNSDFGNHKLKFNYENHTLTIKSPKQLFLAKESIKRLVKPASFAIVVENS
ncbi:Ppx/GppA phosphatase family protein [Sulfurospirillum arcachonense]|uniref:Ppx/GppA phosphatase family protein n=1 Tax=Sulfurospirillum arcachonense TaxID=57666 RepID=UPI0004698463|nr:Ppx/GppA phosphatase family protein [Sulfurospirillum arcachonense]